MRPQSVLLSGVVDVKERYLRALAGLDEAVLAADPGTRSVLRGYRRDLLNALGEFQSTVSTLIEGLQAAFHDDPKTWDQEHLSSLSDRTVNAFYDLQGLHHELYEHLPGTGATPEDLNYFVTRALGLSLMSREHGKLLSVRQSQKLTWETTRFVPREDDKPFAVAVGVPWIEILTPIRWPLVVHELGHYLLPGGRESAQELAELAAQNSWRQNDFASFKEIVADAVAQKAFGDAYTFALAREGYLLSYKQHVEGVSVLRRLELLGSPKDLLSCLPSAWNLGDRAAPGETPRPRMDEASASMREIAVKLVGERVINDPHSVSAARALLANGEPAAAIRKDLSDSHSLLTKLATALAGPAGGELAGEEVRGLTELAVGRSLSDGEILEAALREECERSPGEFLDSLTPETVPDEEFTRQSREVAGRDTWLARSLQSAAVHRWLLEAERMVGDQR